MVDANDHIYALGTAFSFVDDQNVLLYKYNASGTLLWTLNWDAGNNLGDLPADLQVDAGGEAYVTGLANRGNENTTSDDDVFLIRVDNTGNVSWSSIYDHNGYNDGGLTVLLDGTYAYVAANSHSSASVRNRTLLKYNKSTGAQEGAAKRETSSNNEYWTDMEWVDGDLVAIGRKSFDAVIASYDPANLTQNWETTYDAFENGDEAYSMSVSGTNVYVGAHCDNEKPERMVFNFHIDGTDGDILYKHRLEDKDEKGITTVQDVEIQENTAVFLMQMGNSATNKSFLLFYDLNLQSRKSYEFEAGFRGQDICALSDEIFVAGYEFNTADSSDTTSAYKKFKVKDMSITSVSDTNDYGDSIYKYDNLIDIVIARKYLKLSNIDNPDLEFGDLYTFIDSNVVDTILDSTGISIDSLTLYKTYKWKKSSDTLDSNAYGIVFRTYDYYKQLKLFLPQTASAEDVVNDLEAKGGIEFIWEIELPFEYNHSMTPNDSYWPGWQFSLHSNPNSGNWKTDYVNQSVRILDAWKISVGDPKIKVGMAEKRIAQFNHNDLSLNNSLDKSVIKGGCGSKKLQLEYCTGIHFSAHATRTAGIIGAIRNNGKGIAGIVGGTGSNLDGVSIYTYDNDSWEEALEDNVHIMNNSWGGGTPSRATFLNDGYMKGITYINGIGNFGDSEARFPSGYLQERTMSIGGIGIDGRYYKPSNAGHVLDNDEYLSYGSGIDVLAPAARPHIWSTSGSETGNGDAAILDLFKRNEYGHHPHTSGAAPHVSAIAAQLIDLHFDDANDRNSLFPEDIEYLIELGAIDIRASEEDFDLLNKDKDAEGAPLSEYRPMPKDGYDELTGWGRVDAVYTLAYASEPDFKIMHFTEDDFTTNEVVVTTSLVKSNVKSRMSTTYFSSSQYSPAYYDVYEVEIEVDFSNHLPSGYSIFQLSTHPHGGAWPIHMFTNLLARERYLTTSPKGNYVSNTYKWLERTALDKTNETITVKGYIYEKKADGNNTPISPTQWIPFNKNSASSDVTFGFTVHLVKNTVGVQEINELKTRIFPNPASQAVTIELKQRQSSLNVDVMDVNGKLLVQEKWIQPGSETILNLSSLSPGIYFIRLTSPNGISSHKLIKQ